MWFRLQLKCSVSTLYVINTPTAIQYGLVVESFISVFVKLFFRFVFYILIFLSFIDCSLYFKTPVFSILFFPVLSILYFFSCSFYSLCPSFGTYVDLSFDFHRYPCIFTMYYTKLLFYTKTRLIIGYFLLKTDLKIRKIDN